jgi:hypothetical protein
MRGAYGVLVGKTEGKKHLEDLGINLRSYKNEYSSQRMGLD